MQEMIVRNSNKHDKARRIVGAIATVIAFLIPYAFGWDWPWWKFIPASIVIILIRWVVARENFARDLGLLCEGRDFATAALIFITTATIAYYCIPLILATYGYEAASHETHIGWRFFAVFQVLNEEMLLRALLLISLARLFRSRWAASLLAASVFTLLHYGLYRFGLQQTGLKVEALLTLFFFALSCNALFMSTGTIAAPYALHLGWNLTRFGHEWIATTSGLQLSEAESFNLIEGHPLVLALAIILTVITFASVKFRSRTSREASYKETKVSL
jgi:hypothetical protein